MIKPLHEYVVIRPADPPETAGGILIPAAYRDHTANRRSFIRESNSFCAGIVVSVGKGLKESATKRHIPDLEIGSKVFFKRAEAIDVPGENDGLIIVREESVAFEYVEEA